MSLMQVFEKKTYLTKASLLLPALPYLLLVYPNIKNADTFSWGKLLLTIAGVVIFDVIYKIVTRKNNWFILYSSILVFSGTVTFLYGDLIIRAIQPLMKSESGFIRGRFIASLIFFLLIGIQLIFSGKRELFVSFTNKLSLIFSCSILFFSIFSKGTQKPGLALPNTAGIVLPYDPSGSNKPVMLILLDEYSSPDILSGIFTDSNTYSLADHLKNNNWIVKTESYSYEVSTIHSISSLFNFNLSSSGAYASASLSTTGKNLLKAALSDSLEKKNVPVTNLSVFPLGKTKPFYPIYPLPLTFTEWLLSYSLFPHIKISLSNFKYQSIRPDFYIQSEYNASLLKKLSGLLQQDTALSGFIYVHLYMPHGPIQFLHEINLAHYSTDNYFKYWKFTNVKIWQLLTAMKNTDKYRIIITGDHGYRYDKRIDPHKTFTAYYGFDSSTLVKLHAVQDLGLLINSCFRKQ